MSAGDDGLLSFFFYILFVYPTTSWILKPGRFPKKTGLMYAIGFLAVLALGKTYLEFQERGPNYYNELHINRASTPLEIKKAYKKMSLELHPDKNKSPNAADEFARVKDAYDTLMDAELREVYNKFGPEGIKHNRRFDETQLLLEIAVYYATWGMLAFVLTLGKASSSARNWIFTGQIVMLIAEISLMLQETKLPGWLLPTWTEHEFVFLMHSLFPAFMNGCRCLGGFLYVDVEEQTRQKMEQLDAQNKDILLVLRDIQVNMQSIAVSGGGSGGGNSSGRGTGGSSAAGTLSGAPLVKATPTGKIKEMEERLRQQRERGAAGAGRLSEPVKPAAAAGSGMGMWWAIIMYVVFHFVFTNNSS